MNVEKQTSRSEGFVNLYSLNNHVTSIVESSKYLKAVPELHRNPNDDELGRITFGPSGAKLEAVKMLHILPGSSHINSISSVATDPRNEKYELKPISNGRYEIFVLRHGDVISSPTTSDTLKCIWHESEIQVDSSGAEIAITEHSDIKHGAADAPEDETEDEAAPDDTVTEVPVTQPMTQPPHLSEQRSLLVQETPTTDRTLGMSEYTVAPGIGDSHVEITPPPQTVTLDAEPFSTARTGQSPKTLVGVATIAEPSTNRKRPQSSPEVRVSDRRSRKRPSPVASPASELSAVSRAAKRTKTSLSFPQDAGGAMQNSPLDDLNADPSRKTYSTKGKKRTTDVLEVTPSKSQRSSQRSVTSATTEAYSGDLPRVAFSNSAITLASQTVKFLRKHGGTPVESVEDKCNVLCVRDGTLAKTMKVIQAIALGVPIVTDKWLFDSAKAEAFVDLSSYKPSVPEQEKEWGFSLGKVWGAAQSPFKGYSLYFTPALKKSYNNNLKEMERVCQTVGAKVVTKRTSKTAKIIVLASDEEDPDAEKTIEDGEACYHKDLLTISILRGALDLESDEFKITAKPTKGPRRKGARKST